MNDTHSRQGGQRCFIRFARRWRRRVGTATCTSPRCFHERCIDEAFGAARWLWQGWIYTPAVTVWVFLSQCLSPDHSCREAVARLIAWRLSQGLHALLGRHRRLLHGARRFAGRSLPRVGPRQRPRSRRRSAARLALAWAPGARRRRLHDHDARHAGESGRVSAGQDASAGCGFPIARILVVFSLAVGTVLEAAIGQYKAKQTGENSLFRTLHQTLLGTATWCWRTAISAAGSTSPCCRARGIDVVVRKHQLRPTDFRTGQRLGTDDHLVRLAKPQRPDWMSAEQYAALPDALDACARSAFAWRSRLSHEDAGGRDHAAGRRDVSGRGDRRALSPALASGTASAEPEDRAANGSSALQDAAPRAQRIVHAPLGLQSDPPCDGRGGRSRRRVPPWKISFKGTLQTLNNFLPVLASSDAIDAWLRCCRTRIATHRVGNRPDRFEPRV